MLHCPNKDEKCQLFLKQVVLGLLQHTWLYAGCVLQAVTPQYGKRYNGRNKCDVLPMLHKLTSIFFS